MTRNLNKLNKEYWQSYKPGEIPSIPEDPPADLVKKISGPILDIGTGDGILAEKLSKMGHKVYGIDIAKNIIEENLKRKSKVKYSMQDIASKTDFPNNYFDLIIFKFTLTNIHKESWVSLRNEVLRILKPGGKVWLLEPIVSESYRKRYDLASNFINDKNCVYVFYAKNDAERINSKEGLKKAIEANRVSRIIKHFNLKELKSIFGGMELVDHRIIEVLSPSGYKINTFEGVFAKENL